MQSARGSPLVEAAPWHARAGRAAAEPDAGQQQSTHFEEPVEEAQGWRLHRCSRSISNTGYMGVYRRSDGRFEARGTVLHGGHKGKRLGTFGTAVEAAVAFARAAAEAQQCTWAQCQRCEKWRRLQVAEEDLPEQ